MIELLAGIGFIVTCCIPLLGFEGQEPKIFVAALFCSALCLLAFYKCRVKRINNYILLFFIYLVFSLWQMPKISIVFNGAVLSTPYVWKPIVMLFVFIGAYSAIRSFRISHDVIMKILMYSGIVFGCHLILQKLGLNQWFVLNDNGASRCVPSFNVTSFFGHPTYAAPIVATLVPIALYYKNYVGAVLMALGCFLTDSQVGIGAMVVSLVFLLISGSKGVFMACGSLCLLLGAMFVLLTFNCQTVREFVGDSGRFGEWKAIVEEMKEPFAGEKVYAITGHGIGSFRHIHRIRHKCNFHRAHNEYLEIAYDVGITGLIIVVGFIINIFRKYMFIDRRKRYLLASFFCMCVCAGANFVWHLGPCIYLTILLLGMIEGLEERNGRIKG